MYRRIWHWFAWGLAPFFFADAVAEAATRGFTWRSGKSLVSLAICAITAAQLRRDALRLSDTQISVRQPRTTASPVAELADLMMVIWENPREICFGTRAGRPYVVSLGGLLKSERREIREHLRVRVPAYREASSGKLERTRAAAGGGPRSRLSSRSSQLSQ